eukprot:scaffold505229_cov35-Prasinocladus_malaysianus.AAC.1
MRNTSTITRTLAVPPFVLAAAQSGRARPPAAAHRPAGWQADQVTTLLMQISRRLRYLAPE